MQTNAFVVVVPSGLFYGARQHFDRTQNLGQRASLSTCSVLTSSWMGLSAKKEAIRLQMRMASELELCIINEPPEVAWPGRIHLFLMDVAQNIVANTGALKLHIYIPIHSEMPHA